MLPLGAQLLSKDQINERIKANEAVENQADAAEAVKVWGEALVELEAAADALKMESQVRKELEELDKPLSFQVPQELPADAARVDLEAFLMEVEGAIEEHELLIAEINEQSNQAPKVGVTLTAEAEALKGQLKDLVIPAIATTELESAGYQKATQKKARIEAKLKELAARKAVNDKAATVFDARITAVKEHIKNLRALYEKISARIQELKEREAKETREAISELSSEFEKIPELAEIVKEWESIRTRHDRVELMLIEARAYDDRVEEISDRIEKQYEGAKQRISLLEEAKLGVDDETGMLLRKQRARLPSVDEISSELRAKLELVAKSEITLLENADRRKEWKVIPEERILELLKENPKITRERINELVDRRRIAMNKLGAEYREVNKELTKATSAARRTISDIEIYSNFIDQRLLWIKSAKPLHWSEPVNEWNRIVELAGPEMWPVLGESITSSFSKRIVEILLAGLVVVLILLRRWSLRGVLKTSSEKALRRNCTTLKPTLQFIGAALLLCLWLPLVVWVMADLCEASPPWYEGLRRLAIFLFFSSLMLKFSRPDGLFVNHFRIKAARSALFYRNLKWLAPIAPVFVFLIPALTSLENDPTSGRPTFILGMLLMAGFCHHLFLPKRSILQREEGSTGYTRFCYVVIMACPVVFIIGAILGYFESVLTLRDKAGATAALLVLAFLIIRFLTRWTLVTRRKLAITQALQRREAAIAERERGDDGGGKENLPSLEEMKAEAVDVVEVEEQTTKLLKMAVYATIFFGLWGTWASTLPALQVLDKVELWRDAAAKPSETAAPTLLPGLPGVSSEEAKPVTKIMPVDDGRVTLQDLLLTLVFCVLTIVAARNIPGVLSLALFSRINLGPGGNFALTTTVRYLIVFSGIILALGQIGITWGKVQWLAAAVSLGIGFGLQEIFANFVAGIILLFERPIRLGDIVTVGDISGKVTQIRIRATTIRQFNNRELLVPNKEFITSQLVNWTLNDSILRFEIPVGIAYGSDTEKATKILMEILTKHPQTMEEPGPVVFFTGFGNSTLDFEARGFVSSAESLLPTKSELHYEIDHAFREAGIEIAFPQQDIHLRSLPEGMKLTKE